MIRFIYLEIDLEIDFILYYNFFSCNYSIYDKIINLYNSFSVINNQSI